MSKEPKSTSVGSLTIDITNLHEVLAVVEQIKAAAIEARAALASIGVAPAPLGELVAGEIVHDETPGLILAELKCLRLDFARASATGVMVRSCE